MMVRLGRLETLLTAQLHATRLQWLLGLRFAIACGVPPVVGVASGHPFDPDVLRKRIPAADRPGAG